MRRSRNPNYLENLARTLIQRFQIPCELAGRGAHPIDRQFGDQIRMELHRMSPETLGVIAVKGRGMNWKGGDSEMPIFHAGDGESLSFEMSGYELVVEIATRAIVAKMYDILSDELVRQEVRRVIDKGYDAFNAESDREKEEYLAALAHERTWTP